MPLQPAFDETKAYELAVKLSNTLDNLTRKSFPKHRWDVFGGLDSYYVCLVGEKDSTQKGYGIDSELSKSSYRALLNAFSAVGIGQNEDDTSALGPLTISSRSVSTPDNARPMVGTILTSYDSDNLEVIQSFIVYQDAIEFLEENADKIRIELERQLTSAGKVENNFSAAAREDGLFVRLVRGTACGLRNFTRHMLNLDR